MKSIMLQPKIDELYKLQEFIHETISKKDIKIDLIAEEVFVNIVNYSKTDFVKVNACFENSILTLELIDSGFEFNPLLMDDPQFPESVETAEIGGLGIYLTKELSDEIIYNRTNDENHLTIIKKVE